MDCVFKGSAEVASNLMVLHHNNGDDKLTVNNFKLNVQNVIAYSRLKGTLGCLP